MAIANEGREQQLLILDDMIEAGDEDVKVCIVCMEIEDACTCPFHVLWPIIHAASKLRAELRR